MGADLGPILIVLGGSGGILGAVVGLLRLRGSRNSDAIAQAHGANEVLQVTLEAVERERDYWRQRYDLSQAVIDELRRPPRGG